MRKRPSGEKSAGKIVVGKTPAGKRLSTSEKLSVQELLLHTATMTLDNKSGMSNYMNLMFPITLLLICRMNNV